MSGGAGPAARTVLFVSHDASRTGAPILLLEVIEWMRSHHGVQPAVLLLRDGPLVDRFRALGPTAVMDRSDRRAPGQLLQASLSQLGRHRAARRVFQRRVRRARAALPPARVVWLSAGPSLAAFDGLAPPGPVVAHIHELEGVLRESIDDQARFDATLQACDRVIVGAQTVADNLTTHHQVAPAAIGVHAEFIADPSPPGPDRARQAGRLRAQLGLPADALVVGACGTASWRKGMDLFVQLAVVLARDPNRRPVHFVWIGGRPGDLVWDEAQADARRAGVDDRVHFVGEQAELAPWFDLFDVFALTSREDSFPLVCLLAGSHGVPVVAFDTGIGELLRRAGSGPSAVDHLDVERFASRVAVLLADDGLRADEGARLAVEVAAHHTTSTAAEALWNDLAATAGWT